MQADVAFQDWLNNISQEEGIADLNQARLLLQHMKKRQKDVSVLGIVLACFVLSSIKTIVHGCYNLFNISNPTYLVNFDVFSYVIPFISFMLDHIIKKVNPGKTPEKNIYVFFKLLFIIYYLGVYVLSLD